MFFFSRDKISVEDNCRVFYDSYIFKSSVGGVDFSGVLPDFFVQKVDPAFSQIDKDALLLEINALRLEMFALAWTHKYLCGPLVLRQSLFTRKYLDVIGRTDVWHRMADYNGAIDYAVSRWISDMADNVQSAGNKLAMAAKVASVSRNHGMWKDLKEKNIEDAAGVGGCDEECVERANNRVWSEEAWARQLILEPLIITFCKNLGMDAFRLKAETTRYLAAIIRGFYEGAQQSFEKIKIV